MLFTVILAGFLPAVTLADLFLTPPENTWVRLGQENVTLVCAASEKIRACSWITPYGKNYPLESGLTAEGGRLQHFAEDRALECGVLITKVQSGDEGRWRCNVGVVENAEVKTASGMANLSLAVPPEAVFLEKPFNKDTVNVTAGKETSIVCSVENARPAPTFNWTINDVPLDGKTQNEEQFVDTEGLSTFKQTILYTPTWDQMNQTLRCTVTHPGLMKEVNVDVILSVIGTDSYFPSDGSLPTGAIVGIVIALVILVTILTLLALLYRGKCGKSVAGDSADAEEGKQITADENEVEQVPERPASPAIIDDAPAKNFNQRFVAFLGRLRKQDTKKNMDETVASEFEKIELNDTEVGEEKKDEEKTEEEATAPAEKVKLSARVRGFINKFNKRTAKAETEDKPEEDTAKEEDKQDKEDKMEELEPEDKEQKPEEGMMKRRSSETPV